MAESTNVTLPNGVVVEDVPSSVSKDDLRLWAIRNSLAEARDFEPVSENVSQIPKTSGSYEVPLDERGRAGEPTLMEHAQMGAMAVPAMGAIGGAVKLASAGTKLAPYGAAAAKALVPTSGKALAVEGAIGGASGVGAHLASRDVEKGWKRDVAGIVGGAGTGLGVNAIRNIADIPRALYSLTSGSKDVAARTATAMGESQAAQQAATALKANPNLRADLAQGAEIKATTGIELPMPAYSKGDTTLASQVQSEMAKGENANFTAQMRQQYEAAEKALRTATSKVVPSMQAVEDYVKRKAVVFQQSAATVLKKATEATTKRQVGIEKINNRMQELSAKLATDTSPTDIGTSLTNLIAAKEAKIKGELSPLYKNLIESATEANIKLPKEAATELKSFVVDKTSQDIFNKFPSLYSTIKKNFKGAPDITSKTAGKYTFAKTSSSEVAEDIPIVVLDSLKRETNEALRNVQRGSDQHRMLVELKAKVSQAIDAVDPVFSKTYKELDKKYATSVGLPFNEAGVIQVDRATFVEQVVPKITSTASGLKQVLNIVGDTPEGLKIVEDAFLYQLSNNRAIINTNTGEIVPAQLNRYIAANKDKLNMVPGLRQKLEYLSGRVGELKDMRAGKVGELRERRAAIHTAEKEAKTTVAENLWTEAYKTKDSLAGVVRKALSNQQELDKLLVIAAESKTAKGAIKAALLDDVLKAPGDTVALFQSNKKAFEQVFGKEQFNYLTNVVEASQRLKDNPFIPRLNVSTITKSNFEKATGTKFSQSMGEIRNQIMTFSRSLINHSGRYFQHASDRAEATEMQRFLLDPKSLEQASRMFSEIEARGFTERALELGASLLSRNAAVAVYGGAIGAGVANVTTPPPAKDDSKDPLLKGFRVK